MLAKPIDEYFYFGTLVRYLQDARLGSRIHGKSFIIENLRAFFPRLDSLDLQVTRRASRELSAFKEELEAAAPEATLTSEQAERLRELMTNVRRTLVAELAGFKAYVVTPKRLDVRRLLTEVSSLLAPGVFDQLPDIAKYDLEESAKCIAFERSTAAAFHLLRGTEAVLKAFYCSHIKRNRPAVLMWGNMVQGLSGKREMRQHQPLLTNLDNIRLSFRNPTQHPDKIYDVQEVQDLWGLCIDTIGRMTRITRREKKPDQPQTPTAS